MPPFVALFACLTFIAYLLYREYSLNTKCSYALWIPQLWFMICLSRPVSMWLDPYNIITKMNTSGSTIDFIISTILVLASVVVLSRRNINISMILRNNVWITVFYIYCGISVFWSEFPFDLSIRFIKNICYLLPFLIVLTEKDRVEAINKLVRRSGIILIPLSFIFIKYLN